MAANDLDAAAKKHLHSLWKAHGRELVHVASSNELKSAIPNHALTFLGRLHAFFVPFLQQQQQQQQQQHQQQQSSSSDDTTTTNTTSTYNTRTFLKDPHVSALRDYAAFAWNAETHTIRLKEGRSIISLHHPDFLEELNHFELKGATATTEFIRKDSFGAFLYHMPADALRCLGCSLALAMVTLV